MLAASVAGNAHDLGLRAVTDLFVFAGWRCLFLGANVPGPDIAGAAASFEVDLVVLTATLSTQLGQLANTRHPDQTARAACQNPGRRYCLRRDPGRLAPARADGFAAQIADAVQRGAELVG